MVGIKNNIIKLGLKLNEINEITNLFFYEI